MKKIPAYFFGAISLYLLVAYASGSGKVISTGFTGLSRLTANLQGRAYS